MATGPPEMVAQAVFGSSLFERKDDDWKSELVAALWRRPVQGETLIMHGDRDPQFFVVESGRFVAGDVIFGPGQSYGHLHLLSKVAMAHPHDVYGEGVLWWLDRPRFRNALRARDSANKPGDDDSNKRYVRQDPNVLMRTRSEDTKSPEAPSVIVRHKSDDGHDDSSSRQALAARHQHSTAVHSESGMADLSPREEKLLIFGDGVIERRKSDESTSSSVSSQSRRRSGPSDHLSGVRSDSYSRSASPNWWDGPLPSPARSSPHSVPSAPAPSVLAGASTTPSARNKPTGNWWDAPGPLSRSQSSTKPAESCPSATATSSTNAATTDVHSSPKNFFPSNMSSEMPSLASGKFTIGSSLSSVTPAILPKFSRSLPSSASSSPKMSPAASPILPPRANSVISTASSLTSLTASPKRASSVVTSSPRSPASLARALASSPSSNVSKKVSAKPPVTGRSNSSPRVTRATLSSPKVASSPKNKPKSSPQTTDSNFSKPENSPTSSHRTRSLGLSPAATAALDRALAASNASARAQSVTPDSTRIPRTKRSFSVRSATTEKVPGHSRSRTMIATALRWKTRDNIDVTNILYPSIPRTDKPAPEYGLSNPLNEARRSRAVSAVASPPIRERSATILPELPPIEEAPTPEAETEQKGVDCLALGDLVVVGTLGRGAYAHVQLVTETVSNPGTTTVHALKTVNKMLLYEQQQVEHLLSEKAVLHSLHHPFIIKLRRTFKDMHYLHFLMEPCLGGELGTLLNELRFFEKPIALHVAACVVLALEHMHAQGIVYRDLKPDNVLLQPNGYIKLVDFGFAKRVGSDKTHTMCGTPAYLAPEVIAGEGYGITCDWWTLGVLLYEMMVGETPFQTDNPMATYQLIMANNPQFPDDLPESDREFILRLLQPSDKRLSNAQDVKNDPWFEGTDWARLLRLDAVVPPEVVVEVQGETDISKFDDAFGEDERWSDWVPLDSDPFEDF